jgi:hypothetical protein
MEKEQRTRLQKATQDARKLLEEEFRSQLLQTYDIDVEKVRWAEEPGAHLLAEQRLIREKLIAWIEHKEAQIVDRKEALLLALREMAFTALNRFVALKLMEARELVRPCVSGGLESAGFLEFTAVAQGLLADQESSYRLYLETIFEDVSRELRALFEPRDPASLLWLKRAALLELLDILNRPELAELWSEDETLGWVYQYFNGDAERKKMREESAAPRNSRELAVRNQFFTPRYVVEFLTDNTLGRIWYEMRQGQTGLKDRCRYLVRRPNEIWLQPGEEAPAQPDREETLSHEELLRQQVHIPYRELKDPREIRLLDPACGSMHFGLYAFDLYLEIYEEAWEIAQGSDEQAKQGEAFAAFVAYTADFASKADFLREVPRLILLHNIHGVDIDPRATQIARLTLWLRAQRAWQEQGVEVAARPAISRSNVVCAEPMPGERDLLADFVDQQFPEAERGLVLQLLESVFDKMQLAGEAGSLLRIDETIRDAIDQARRGWQILAVQQKDLFSPAELEALGQVGASLNADLQGLTRDFWINIEERIYASLRDYAEQVENRGGFQRRLFVEDAAQGFAFIDLCSKRHDVILMNPPFGDASVKSRQLLSSVYPDSKHDVAATFVERSTSLLAEGGLIGCISTRTLFFLPTSEKWRISLYSGARINAFADLGLDVMDAATVYAAAYTLSKRTAGETTFFRGTDWLDKKERLLSSVHSVNGGEDSEGIYVLDIVVFSNLPGWVMPYYLPAALVNVFSHFATFGEMLPGAKQGIATSDDFRFVRACWEAPISRDYKWIPHTKGGSFSPYHVNTDFVLNWESNGREVKAYAEKLTEERFGAASWSRWINAVEYYFRPGLTFTYRSRRFGVSAMQPGAIFGVTGMGIFIADEEDSLLECMAVMNSSVFNFFLLMLCERRDPLFQAGKINSVPWPLCTRDTDLARLAESGYFDSAFWNSLSETSPFFCSPTVTSISAEATIGNLVSSERAYLSQALLRWVERQQSIDKRVSFHYQIDSVAFNALREELAHFIGDKDHDLLGSPAERPQAEIASSILSYFVGLCFGRWDIGSLRVEKRLEGVPRPFKALPTCPPGQLQNAHGFPVGPEDLARNYPINIPWVGVLVCDKNDGFDICNRACKAIHTALDSCGADASINFMRDICNILDVVDLSEWFLRPTNFFADHLKRYSKSRRQAPIYWQLSINSGNYAIWLYYHRFNKDTLYRVQRDFIEPRIQQAEREQFELESQGALSGDAAARLQEAHTLLQDLRILKSELDLVAPLWNPNLNDGVIINHAILWRITPYTPWQKKCKECWDKLVRGDYDWAHLALHLWPERVIPTCTTDRSLAIAHGLEERLWQETNNGNWLPRQLSEADLQALIAEHSNPAVKSALERFLAAPPPVAPTRTRASRSTRASGSSAPRRPRGTAAVVDAEATRQVLLALTAAPSDGLAKAAIADLIGVEANALTAVIKQLKDSGHIDQLGERRGARYVLSEQGRAAVEQVEAG